MIYALIYISLFQAILHVLYRMLEVASCLADRHWCWGVQLLFLSGIVYIQAPTYLPSSFFSLINAAASMAQNAITATGTKAHCTATA